MEKAFDRVPREVTRWALRKAGEEEWFVNAVLAMYAGAQTVVRTTKGEYRKNEGNVGIVLRMTWKV